MDHPWRPGHVERRPVAERRDLGEGLLAEAALSDAEEQECDERTDPDLAGHLVLRLHFAPGHGRVELVDPRRHPELDAEPLGEADVVGVAVGQDHCPDVVERPAHCCELRREVAPETRQPGVDDRDLRAVGDEVGVDAAVAEAVEAWGDLHSRILLRRAAPVSPRAAGAP
jgi:hypothetical protein